VSAPFPVPQSSPTQIDERQEGEFAGGLFSLRQLINTPIVVRMSAQASHSRIDTLRAQEASSQSVLRLYFGQGIIGETIGLDVVCNIESAQLVSAQESAIARIHQGSVGPFENALNRSDRNLANIITTFDSGNINQPVDSPTREATSEATVTVSGAVNANQTGIVFDIEVQTRIVGFLDLGTIFRTQEVHQTHSEQIEVIYRNDTLGAATVNPRTYIDYIAAPWIMAYTEGTALAEEPAINFGSLPLPGIGFEASVEMDPIAPTQPPFEVECS